MRFELALSRTGKDLPAAGKEKLTTSGMSAGVSAAAILREVETSVADPDPGPGAFLTPGSGIQNRFFPDP
jgi:hypothetical protein